MQVTKPAHETFETTAARIEELLGGRVRNFARSFAYRKRVFEALRGGEKFGDGNGPTVLDMNGAHIHVEDQGRALCELIKRPTGTPPWVEWTPPDVP